MDEAALRQLQDRSEITELVNRYASRIDDGDMEGLLACFTADAHAEYNGGTVTLRGHAELRHFFASAFENRVGPRQPSTHLIGGVIVEIDGDSARGDTTAVAYLTHSPGCVTVRGLRYRDSFVRDAGGWLIARREHSATWQYEAPGGPVRG
jgi:ketosteroid isomerase-like protein